MNTPMDLLDWAAIQERFEGDVALFCEIARLFLEDHQKRVSVMQDALACRDCKTLERVAHSLRGSVSNFAASEAIAATRTLEEAAHVGDLPGATIASRKVEFEINRLAAALAEMDRGYAAERLAIAL
jgi:HPt (histidine-containing phosphotransfer) domain-containing protein